MMKCLLVFGLLGAVVLAARLEKYQWTTVFQFPSVINEASYSANHVIRIVGGQEACPHQFPFQAGLYIEYAQTTAFCGGSLISPNYILTAAHCAQGAVSIEVVLGAHNISNSTESSRQVQTINSSSIVVHSDWNSDTLVNDLAVIKLNTAAIINDYVQVVTLATGIDTYANQQAIATGWGKTTDSNNELTDILRYETNNILSNTDCKNIDSDYDAIVEDIHLCLAGTGQTSICKGDSGGPLVTNGIQVGISSFSYKTCESSKPSVFTRVTEFSDWIRNISDIEF